MSYKKNDIDLSLDEMVINDNYNFNLRYKKDYVELGITKKQKDYIRNDKKNVNDDRLKEHLSRARRNINDILTHNLELFHSMVTLTYKENMKDYDKSRLHFQMFIRKLGNPHYLQVRELQKRGAIHYHIILFKQFTELDIINAWGRGRIDLQLIEDLDINRITNYFAKYITNQQKGQLIDKNKRLYNVSRGIKRTRNIKVDSDILRVINEKNCDIELNTKRYTKLLLSVDKLDA